MEVEAPTELSAGEPGAQIQTADGGRQDGLVRSVQRAMEIMSLLREDHPDVTIKEAIALTGLPKSTVLRLLRTLEQVGLLQVVEPGRYGMGLGLLRWAHMAARSLELPARTTQLLSELAMECQETVSVYSRRDIYRVSVAQFQGPQMLKHIVAIGDELPLWAGASGSILLIGAPDELLSRVAAASPYGAAAQERLRTRVAHATDAGYAKSDGERELGASSVAVPVWSTDHRVAAALTVGGPSSRFTEERVAGFVDRLRAAAQRVDGDGLASLGGLAR